jgi:hypothetical protein
MKKRIILSIFILILIIPLSQSIIISEFEANPAGTDTNNEWIELYSDEIINLSDSNYTLVNGDNDIYNLNETFSGFLIISLSGQWLDNSDETINLKNNSDILFQTPTKGDSANDNKTWQYCSNSDTWIFETQTKGTANICSVNQQNQTQNSSNNSDSSTQTQQSNITESSISLFDSTSEEYFGSIIDVDLDIYRGETDKYAIYIYIENSTKILTEKFTIHLKKKYTNYSFQIPVYIPDNCKFNEGKYNLIAEGINLKEEETIWLKRNLESDCYTNTNTGNASKNQTESILNQKTQGNNSADSNKSESNNINSTKSITGNIIYQSKEKLSGKKITFLLSLILFCLLVYSLIIKKQKSEEYNGN